MSESVPAETKAEFLEALAHKGETIEEIAGFAQELLAHAIIPELDPTTRNRVILDVVGTGGDRLGTFNISTATALVCAAAGVTVAKHGNRAATSQCGSADVLEKLGIRIDLGPTEAAQWLRTRGFAFFFAPKYHPAFKHVAPARKLCAQRGQRTIFNFLGPLLNPARPTAMLVGVPRPELCEPIARVLQSLGVRRAMVVCGQVRTARAPVTDEGSTWDTAEAVFMDEFSTLGPSTIAEFHDERGVTTSSFDPAALPIQPAGLHELRGGDAETNAQTLRAILNGTDRGPKRDVVLLNAAAA
ncbi:MAG: anthranilate phosphoribosyltransferase, partial [Verrucomicrobiae bacterium]|nr:anthranilate phosphoribosyltransferase [Verrucomicrobiae bacterium]